MTPEELAHAALFYSDHSAWLAAENARLIQGQVPDDEAGSIADLMAEAPSNHGRRRSELRYADRDDGRPGEVAPHAHSSLDSDTLTGREFAATAGASVVGTSDLPGGVGYEPGEATRLFAPDEWSGLDADAVRTAVLAELGFTDAEFRQISLPGRPDRERQALKDAFDDALLAAVEAGGDGTASYLGRALGWWVRHDGEARRGSGHVKRMSVALKRARRRRDASA